MKTQSLRQGSTVQARALLFEQAVATSAPPVGGTDVYHCGIGPVQAVELLWKETNAGTCDLEVYWYYTASGTYVRDDTLGKISVNASSIGGVVLTPSAADGLYVSLTNFAGAKLTVHAQGKYA